MKAVNLNCENLNVLNDSGRTVHNTRKIKRKHGGVVLSKPERKEYKDVFKKR